MTPVFGPPTWLLHLLAVVLLLALFPDLPRDIWRWVR